MTKLCLDTNVILRFLLKDNGKLYTETRKIFNQAASGDTQLHIISQVIFESVYVMEKLYGLDKQEVCSSLITLLSETYVKADNKNILLKSLQTYLTENSISLVDIYLSHMCSAQGFKLVTFDKKLLKFHS